MNAISPVGINLELCIHEMHKLDKVQKAMFLYEQTELATAP